MTSSAATHLSHHTEGAVRDFVRAALSVLAPQNQQWVPDSQWKCGPQGDFYESTNSVPLIHLNSDSLHSLREYDACITALKSDPVVGPHLGKLVGTKTSSLTFDADNVLWHVIRAMADDKGALVFTDERFDRGWRKIAGSLCSNEISITAVAPLPRLRLSHFPLRLNNELVLDQFNEQEVTRCCNIGVLQPLFPQYPTIQSRAAVGIRKTVLTPKIIWTGHEAREPLEALGEGTFGRRPLLMEHLVVEDVLSAFRLFKHTGILCTGYASWTDVPWLMAGTSYRVLPHWRYADDYELSESETTHFLELWRLLEDGAATFPFSIHRFNLAFDRGILADRIVDLIIAAESLFLSDLEVQDRGELRFRFALRAAKFIEHPNYGERDIFRVMRRAYDARSAVVHGGSPRDTSLPDDKSANLAAFTGAIEELVRLALRKALSMKDKGTRLRNVEYWDGLVFSSSNE